MATQAYHFANGRETSVIPYHCPRCGKGQAFETADMLRLHLQIYHQRTDYVTDWEGHSSSSHESMQYYSPEQPAATRGLSPNAQELGRQIARARQLMQKQRRAEFRAAKLLNDRPASRPYAHVTPRRKSVPLSDDETGSEDISLEKYGTHRMHQRPLHLGDVSTSQRHYSETRNLSNSEEKKDLVQASPEELITKWKSQREIRKLEASLQDKTREVADLRTQVDQTMRVAEEKDRNISDVNAFLQETALKQSIAKEKLRRYIDSLADRAERAESEVEELKSSLSPPKTDTSSRSDPRSRSQSTQQTYSKINASYGSRADGTRVGQRKNSVNYTQVMHTLSQPDDIPSYIGHTVNKPFPGSGLIPRDVGALSSIPFGADDKGLPASVLSSVPPAGASERRVPDGGYIPQEYPSLNNIPSLGYTPYTRHHQESPLNRPVGYPQHSLEASIKADPIHPISQSLNLSSLTPPSLTHAYPQNGNLFGNPLPDHLGVTPSHSQMTSSYLPVRHSLLGNGGANRDRINDEKDPTDWGDMNFLEEVAEEVLARRRELERRDGESPYLLPTSGGGDAVPVHSRRQGYGYEGINGNGHHRALSGDEEDSELESASDVSVTSESQWSEDGRLERHAELGKSIGGMMSNRRRAALFLVFSYLTTSSRLNCATVCREWRVISREPALWQYVRLHDRRISSVFLQTISKWCTQLRWLILERLSPRDRRIGEERDVYQKKIRGCLEPGIEGLLQSAGTELLTVKIVDCPHIITERALWLVSCHSRCVRSLTYISRSDPIGPEVLWALGAGCRQIKSLKIPLRHPCDRPKKFNSSCISMIGRCWNQLQALSVGGSNVKPESLALVAKSCPKLQVLELDHMIKITEERAIPLCRGGLRGLHTLILKHTPITPSAVIHFNGACPQLNRISVHLSVSDFFPTPASTGQKKEFSRAIETLLDLGRKRALEDVLQVRADYK